MGEIGFATTSLLSVIGNDDVGHAFPLCRLPSVILCSRIIRSQTVHMTTGSTRPRLSNSDVATCPSPSPAWRYRVQ